MRNHIVLGVALFLLSMTIVNGQEKIRKVEKEVSFPNQPIEIVGRQLDEKTFVNETEVSANEDWLQHLSIAVKNVSARDIRAFDLGLLFRREGTMTSNVEFPIYFRHCNRPTVGCARTKDGEVKLGVLRPGEVVLVHVRDHELKIFGDILKRDGVNDVRHVQLEILTVGFDDGSRWMFGQESKPDPSNPNKNIQAKHSAAQAKASTPQAVPRISRKARVY